MNERIVSVFEKFGRPFMICLLLFSLPAILFITKIGNLIPANIVESSDRLNINSFNNIIDNGLFGPIRFIQLAANELGNGNIMWLRLVSAFFATLAGILLYLVIKQWHTRRIALMISAMFISSSWVMHHARLANLEVMYTLVFPALMLIGTWLAKKSNDTKLPLSMALLSLVLYVPGAWLFVIGGIYLFRSQIVRTWRQVSLFLKSVSIGLLLAAISPLIYSFVKRKDLIAEWLGIANLDSISASSVFNNIIDIPKELFYSGPVEPITWLIGTPIFDVFTIILLLLGIYAYKFGSNPIREKILFASVIISILLISVGTTSHIGILLPVLYLIAANGLAYLLQAWFTVFPRNPFARSLGLFIVIISVVLSCSYHLQRYFVAWPNAPATKKVISDKQ